MTSAATKPAPVKSTISVPVKPMAGTAANVGALAVAAIAAGGTAAVTVTGVGLGGVAALAAGRKAIKDRKAKKSAAAATRTATSTTRGATSRTGTGTTGRSTGTGTGRGKATPGSGKGSLLGKLAGAAGRRSTSAGTGRGASGGKAAGAARSGTTGTRSGRRGAGTGSAGSTGRLGRASRAAAHRASRIANSPARRWAAGHLRRAATQLQASAAQSRAATRAAQGLVWGWARRFVQRRLMGRDGKPAVVSAGKTPTVSPTLTGGLATSRGAADVTPRVVPPLSPAGSQAGTTTSGGIMIDNARAMAAHAAEYDAPGLLAIISELEHNVAPSLRHVADAIGSVTDKSRNRWEFHDSIVSRFNDLTEALGVAAHQARTIVADIYITEDETITKLRNITNGVLIRDASANGAS